MTSGSNLDSWLQATIAESRDRPVLLVGDAHPPAGGGDITHVADPRPGATKPGAGRRFDLAIVVGVLENLDHEAAAALIAELRDLTASRLLVVVPARYREERHRSAWSREDMLAHGLETLDEIADGEDTVVVYGFDIDRYKRTPDWLNARGWANPENWGKFRW